LNNPALSLSKTPTAFFQQSRDFKPKNQSLSVYHKWGKRQELSFAIGSQALLPGSSLKGEMWIQAQDFASGLQFCPLQI
ncbi:MAG: hypothetical protein K2M80_03700, partial [Muribaculaceae bacterium]|nr:hypothetical protein [Muribaculaceae bacterium]